MNRIVFITPNFINDKEFLEGIENKPIIFNPNKLFSTLNWKLNSAEWVEISANAINVIMDSIESKDLIVSNFSLGKEISTLAEYLKDFYDYEVYWVIPSDKDKELSIKKNIEVFYSSSEDIKENSVKYKAILSGIMEKYKNLDNTPSVIVKKLDLNKRYTDIFGDGN